MALPLHPLITIHLTRLGATTATPSSSARYVPTGKGALALSGGIASLLLDTRWPQTPLSHQHSRWLRIEELHLGEVRSPQQEGLIGPWTGCGRWEQGPVVTLVRPPGWEASQNPAVSFIAGNDRPNAMRDAQGRARDWASFLARTGPVGTVFGSLEEAQAQPKRVEVLCLEGARLRELPSWIGELSSLKVLLLGNNELIALPESIGSLKELEYLDLGMNRGLQALPTTIGALRSLKVLRVTGTRLTLGDWLQDLESLEFLEANNLPEPGPTLPENSLSMPRLKTLIGGWQPWVVELPALQRLEGYLPEEALPLLRKARELRVLHAKTETSYVPPSLYALDQLTVLAGFRNVERLPPGIGWLKQLQVLSITGGENTLVLPSDLGELENLEHLLLGNCHLTRLPATMPLLSRLKTLVFYGHNLRDLPVGFRTLKSLEMVDLGDGRIRQVPRVLAEFPRLRKLRLARNTIGKAPDPEEELQFLSSLPALEELDLTTNAFSPTLKAQLPERLPGIKVEG